jgi:gliding motility-associated-like protein
MLRDSVQFIYTPKPVANFSIDSTLKPNFCFTNLSQKSNLYRWSFQGKSTGDIRIDSTVTKSNICFNYTDLGTFYVCLIAESGVVGCSDTFCGEVSYNQSIFLANVFTPGVKDGKNDEFRVPISGQEYFEIEVFNRWGTLIFKSKDPSVIWNGQVENTGEVCSAGTYFYLLKYKFPNQDSKSIHGSVMLIR